MSDASLFYFYWHAALYTSSCSLTDKVFNMKKAAKKIGKVLTLSAVIMVCAACWPYVQGYLSSLLAKLPFSQSIQVISHEMRQVGKLTALEYTDQGVLTNTTDALLIGTVQTVSVPYQYDIALGIDLEQAQVEERDGRLTIYLPQAQMLLDSLTVTGESKVSDFWGLLTQERYQAMLNAHQEELRSTYLNNPEVLTMAWTSACETLKGLLSNWLHVAQPLDVAFKPLIEYQGAE